MFAVNTDTYPAGKYVQMINKDLVYFSIYSQQTFRRKRKKAADIEEAKKKKGGGGGVALCKEKLMGESLGSKDHNWTFSHYGNRVGAW